MKGARPALTPTVYLVRNRTHHLQGFLATLAEGVQLGQRVAIYCRVSTADQSCERQERDLLAFAERGGSSPSTRKRGRARKTDRIERKKIMALAQAREIDAIVVTELSR